MKKITSLLFTVLLFLTVSIFAQNYPSNETALKDFKVSSNVKTYPGGIPWNLGHQPIQYKQWTDWWYNAKKELGQKPDACYIQFSTTFNKDASGTVKEMLGAIYYQKQNGKWVPYESTVSLHVKEAANLPKQEQLDKFAKDYLSSANKNLDNPNDARQIICIKEFKFRNTNEGNVKNGILLQGTDDLEYSYDVKVEWANLSYSGKETESIENRKGTFNVRLKKNDQGEWYVKKGTFAIESPYPVEYVEQGANGKPLTKNYVGIGKATFDELYQKRKEK